MGRTGLILVNVDQVHGDQPWYLYVVRGLAIDVPDVGGALAWVNSKNRVSTFEKFYCTVTPEQDRCAVVGSFCSTAR